MPPLYVHIILPELHADLISHHASPLEVYVFVAVDGRREDVTSDEICRRLAELHGGLFSRHASPLEVNVFVVIDERGEGVVFDESCRRCNGKGARTKRCGRSVQLPDGFMVLNSLFALISRLENSWMISV